MNSNPDFYAEYILSIDTASFFPTVSLTKLTSKSSENFPENLKENPNFNVSKNEFENNPKTLLETQLLDSIKLYKPVNISSKTRRYDATNFLNQIIELCEKNNCKPQQIKTLLVCLGPGPFSSIRITVIIARFLKKLNPQIQVYNFELLYLLFLSKFGFGTKNNSQIYLENSQIKNSDFTEKQLTITDQKWNFKKLVKIISPLCERRGAGGEVSKTLALNAGLKGYFKTKISFNSVGAKPVGILKNTYLAEELEQDDLLLNQEEKETNLSELMLSLLQKPNIENFQITKLEDIQANYVREPSVTKKSE